jgi:hypothetical protein
VIKSAVRLEQLALDADAASIRVPQGEIEVRRFAEPIPPPVIAHGEAGLEVTRLDASARNVEEMCERRQFLAPHPILKQIHAHGRQRM